MLSKNVALLFNWKINFILNFLFPPYFFNPTKVKTAQMWNSTDPKAYSAIHNKVIDNLSWLYVSAVVQATNDVTQRTAWFLQTQSSGNADAVIPSSPLERIRYLWRQALITKTCFRKALNSVPKAILLQKVELIGFGYYFLKFADSYLSINNLGNKLLVCHCTDFMYHNIVDWIQFFHHVC